MPLPDLELDTGPDVLNWPASAERAAAAAAAAREHGLGALPGTRDAHLCVARARRQTPAPGEPYMLLHAARY